MLRKRCRKKDLWYDIFYGAINLNEKRMRKSCMVFLLLTLSASVAKSEMICFPRSAYEGLSKKYDQGLPEVSLYVLVDQSVGFDDNIKNRVIVQVNNWLKSNRYIEIAGFSSAVKGRYFEVVTSGRLDAEADEHYLNNLKRSDLIKYQKFHRKQHVVARQQVNKSIRAVFDGSESSIPHSDIISSIKDYSLHIKKDNAKRKVLLILSDMFENSSLTSFYKNGAIKNIVPEDELQIIISRKMIPEFSQDVTVYVMGMGFYWGGEGAKSEEYLDPERSNNLKIFWENYFTASNAVIGEIGFPLMHGSIK